MYHLVGLIQITRPHNCLGAALATLLGAYLVGGTPLLLSPPVIRATLVVWLIVAACNAINDRIDLAADRLNKPQRAIPSGRVSVRAAGRLALLLSLIGLAVAWTLGLWSVAIALAALALGVGYSCYLKSTVFWGNGVVGLLCGITVVYGGLVAGGPTPVVAVASLLVFLFVFAREILKTIADQKGDALVGVSTVATRLGKLATLRIFQVFAILCIAMAVLPWFLGLAPHRYLYAVLPGFVLPILGVVVLLSLRFTDHTIRLSLRVTKFVWFSGLLTMVMLK